LIVGTEANRVVTVTLAHLYECGRSLSRAGKVPRRLAPVNVSMKAACSELKEGSLMIARGIGEIRKRQAKAGVATIQKGIGELAKGSAKLRQAQKRLTSISKQNPNAR
jgi:hypothetical protein